MRKFLITYYTKKSTGNVFLETKGNLPTSDDIIEIERLAAIDDGLDFRAGNAVVTGIYELSTEEGLSNA